MGKKLIIDEETLIEIANAIREKENSTSLIKTSNMADKIKNLTLSSDIEVFDGDYLVIPKTYKQILSTSSKKMSDDVTVESIPFSRVSNDSGGETFNIGETLMTTNGLSLAFEE
jgi:hypothetical protein